MGRCARGQVVMCKPSTGTHGELCAAGALLGRTHGTVHLPANGWEGSACFVSAAAMTGNAV